MNYFYPAKKFMQCPQLLVKNAGIADLILLAKIIKCSIKHLVESVATFFVNGFEFN